MREERSLLNAIAERLGKITERVRAEAALHKSEEKWRSITEYSPDYVSLLDPEANILFINHALPGLTKEDVIGTSFYDYALQEYRQRTRECFEGVLQTGNPDKFESVYQYEDGTRRHFESHVGPVRSGDKTIGLTVSSRDITGRRRAQEALRRERDLISAVLDTAGALVLVLDPQGRIVRFNRACEKLTGYTFDEVEGERFWELFLIPEEVEPVRDVFEELRAGQFPNEYENFWATRDGSRRRIAWSNTALVDDAGAVEYVIATGIDITERERAEEALSTLLDISHHMTLTLELEPLLILILDQLQAVVDYDNATILGLEDGNLVTLVHRGTIPPEEMLPLKLSLEDARLARRLVLDQERIIIPDVHADTSLARDFTAAIGERIETVYGQTCSWMGVPLEIKDRVIGVLALQHCEADHFTLGQVDLAVAFANQAAVAIENTRLYEQAQAVATLEERQRLARDLHDAVSQTLFSASLAADVLPRLWERKPEEGRRCLDELQLLTRSALAEMRTLLLELRPAALMDVGLDELLRQLVEAAMSRARIPVVLSVEGECSLPPDVHVTFYRIAQEALSNIVKHATASQAMVSLHCSPPFPAPSEGENGARGRVELRVEDDGRGFDPKNVPVDRLGLHIMRERAKAIGAAIRIEGQVGQGTRLVVLWPGTA